MSDLDINWEDPPLPASPPLRSAQRWRAALRTHPGKWAKYPRSVSRPYASSMKVRLSEVGYEVRYAPSDEGPGRRSMWARYIGEEIQP